MLGKLLWALWTTVYSAPVDGDAVCATAFRGILTSTRRLHGCWAVGGYDQSRQVTSRHSTLSHAVESVVPSRSARLSGKHEWLLSSLSAHFPFFIVHLDHRIIGSATQPTRVFLEISRYLCTRYADHPRVKLDVNRIHPPSNPGCHEERAHWMGMAFLAAELRPSHLPEIVGIISGLGRFCNSARSLSGLNPRTHGFRLSHFLHPSTCPPPQFSSWSSESGRMSKVLKPSTP